MHLITLQLTGPEQQMDQVGLTELIESHIEASDQVEHLRIRTQPGRVDLAAFLLGEDEIAAENAARAVFRRVIERTPMLAGWRISGSSGVPAEAGMRSTARFLSSSISLASTAVGATAHAFLDRADAALARLVDLVGGHITRGLDQPRGRDLKAGLQADAERIERMVEVYAGARRMTAWQRYQERRTVLTELLARVGSGLGLLRESLGSPADPSGAERPAMGIETFADDWSPISGPESEAFARAMGRTQCVFARRSTIWTAPWHGPTIADAVGPWSRTLRGFVEAIRREPLDGFLLALPAEFGETVDQLSATTRRVLEGLAAQDGRGRCDLSSPEREGWHFRFGRERMFVVTMAPCYPEDHSRYAFGEPYTFILLQPDRAFDRAVSPGSGGLISDAVRSKIRRQYERHGRPYDLSITLSPFEAFRFVKPLNLGDEPVRWWRGEPAQEPSERDR